MTNTPPEDVPFAAIVPYTPVESSDPEAMRDDQQPRERSDRASNTQSSHLSAVPGPVSGSRAISANGLPSSIDALEIQRRQGPNAMAALGGSVASAVLGVWTVVTVWITSWAVFIAVLGILLGLWGLSSSNRRLAWSGIALNSFSVVSSVMAISKFFLAQ